MKLYIPAILILIFAFGVFGQSNGKIKVKLSVNARDTSLATTLYKSLFDELSLIEDIQLQDDFYTFELQVVAMEIKTSKGAFVGYALSTVITSGFLCKDFLAEEDIYKPNYKLTAHTITLTDRISLKKDIKEIVNYFNSRIEPTRQATKGIKIVPR